MAQSKSLVKSGCEIPADFGYVCGAAVGSVFVNQYLAFKVMKARKEFDVKYPRLYHAEPEHKFNCVQRAHQNFMETQPVFLTVLFVSGLKFPRAAASFGVIYLAGRVVYAYGYSTGEPRNRLWGAFGHILGLLPLVGLSVYTVLDKVGCLANFRK